MAFPRPVTDEGHLILGHVAGTALAGLSLVVRVISTAAGGRRGGWFSCLYYKHMRSMDSISSVRFIINIILLID